MKKYLIPEGKYSGLGNNPLLDLAWDMTELVEGTRPFPAKGNVIALRSDINSPPKGEVRRVNGDYQITTPDYIFPGHISNKLKIGRKSVRKV